MGISQNMTSTPGSQPGRPGKITRGPGSNKPNVRVKGHLVASKGKMSAEVYAQAVARMQAVGFKTPPTGENPHVKEAAMATAVGTYHENPHPVKQRKELTKEYQKMAGLRVDGRNSKQRIRDASQRLNGGA
jgi:hypothetical protein